MYYLPGPSLTFDDLAIFVLYCICLLTSTKKYQTVLCEIAIFFMTFPPVTKTPPWKRIHAWSNLGGSISSSLILCRIIMSREGWVVQGGMMGVSVRKRLFLNPAPEFIL